MSDTSTQDFYTRQADEARGPEPQGPPKPKRRLKRVIIASSVSLVVTLGAVVGGTFLYVSHELGSVHRVHVAALTAANQPLRPTES